MTGNGLAYLERRLCICKRAAYDRERLRPIRRMVVYL